MQIPGHGPLPEGIEDDWGQFFINEETRQPGKLVYPDVFKASRLFPLQRVNETVEMVRKAQELNPKIIYEIGADKGGGLYHWCKCFPTVKQVIACEIRGTPYREEFEKAFPHIDFLWLPVSSYDPQIVDQVAKWVKNPIDVLFIDGDKSRFHVDFDVYLPLMNNPSIVFMHDIQDESTGNSFKTTQAKYNFKTDEHIDTTESTKSIEQEKLGKPPISAHDGWLRYWKGSSCGVGTFYIGDH